MESLVQRLVQVRPSPRQIEWQKLEFTAFLHFGVNTFTDREWGTGAEDPGVFNPSALDTDQWCESLKVAGIRSCIITAKHHDGFCLWDTKQTDHSVMSSPYGKDVVAQLSASCEKFGLKLGVYLSPWDRHEPRYGEGEAYNDYFCAQLEELATGYGDIYTFWFDGACGEGKNGKKQRYDWDRYYALIRARQPGAVISICGPDVRWCGNEAGHCRPSEWSVVSSWMADAEKVHGDSQKADDASFREQTLRNEDIDLGSREILSKEPGLIWYPAEVDVSIRPGWFYHEEEDGKVKSLETLLDMYEKSVGGNAVLLLNVPPDRRGLIHENDTARLKELGDSIRAITSRDAAEGAAYSSDQETPEHPAQNAAFPGEGFWKPADGEEQASLTIRLKEEKPVACVLLQEEISESQRIEAFVITVATPGGGKEVYRGTTVGHKKLCRFEPVETDTVTIRITQSRIAPTLRFARVYEEPATH